MPVITAFRAFVLLQSFFFKARVFGREVNGIVRFENDNAFYLQSDIFNTISSVFYKHYYMNQFWL